MKKILIVIFLVINSIASATTYYVSSSGSDSANGLSESAPWRTIGKVNSMFSSFNPGDKILFRRGDTFFGTLKITKSGINGNPITIGAYGTGSNPVITGLTRITSWTNMGGGIYSAPLTSESDLNMVNINGMRYKMGRYPNNSYLIFESHVSTVSITDNQLPSSPNWTGSEVVIRKKDYVLDRCRITDHSGTIITYTNLGSSQEPYDNFGYFIQNDIRTLDIFGEWYHDGSKLYVYFGSNAPSSYDVRAGSVDNLVFSEYGDYITFENISFFGANHSAFHLVKTDFIVIKNCRIDYSGENGIYSYINTYTTFDNNIINNSLRAGIYCDGGHHATITNNEIRNSGLIPGGAFNSTENNGIYLSYKSDCLVQYNTIENAGYNGIKFSGSRVSLKNNLIMNCCLILNDGGGIYTGGTGFSDMVIDGNIILNVTGNTDGTNHPNTNYYAEGIFIDARANDIKITNNTAVNCSRSGIFFNESYNNICTGNTCFNNLQQARFQSDNIYSYIRDITFSDNILFAKTTDQLSFWARSNYEDFQTFMSSDKNYFARPLDDTEVIYSRTPTTRSQYRTLDGWQSYSGHDLNSKKSPVSLTDTANIDFYYNGTKTDKLFNLSTPMVDVTGTKYVSTITLAPYTSVILMVDPDPEVSVIPLYSGSVIENETPSVLTMIYNTTLANVVPVASSFSVMVNSDIRSVSKVEISGSKVNLTLSAPVSSGDKVTVAYSKPTTSPLQSSSGGVAESLSAMEVTNNVTSSGLVYVSSFIGPYPSVLEMTYSLTLADIVPETSAFTVLVNSRVRAINSVTVTGTRVILYLSYGVRYDDVVTVAYTRPATNPLQTSLGVKAESISAQTVSNNLDSPVPVYKSSVIENTTPSLLEMIYNSTLANIVPSTSSFSVVVNSVMRSITKVTISGSSVLLTLESSVSTGDVVTVAYTKPEINPLQNVNGGEAEALSAKSVTNNVSEPVPVYLSSFIGQYPSVLEMTYNMNLEDIVPSTSSFEVLVNSGERGVKSVAVIGAKVLLYLEYGVDYGDNVTVAYTRPTTNPLQSTTGAKAESMNAQPVSNNVASPFPVYINSNIENATPDLLEMNYNSTLANIIPSVYSFSVKVNYSSRSISKMAISGSKVLLTLASPVSASDVITIAYTKPSTNPLQNTSGGEAESLSTSLVTNNVITPVPVYLSSFIGQYPSVLEMTYSLNLADIVPSASAFTVLVNSRVRLVNSVSVTGTAVRLYLEYGVRKGDVITVAYTRPSTNPLQTPSGGKAESMSPSPVTNNVTLSKSDGQYSLSFDYEPVIYSGFVYEINVNNNIDQKNELFIYDWDIPQYVSVSTVYGGKISFLAPEVARSETVKFSLSVSNGIEKQLYDIPIEIKPYKPDLKQLEIIKSESSNYFLSDQPSNAYDNNSVTKWSVQGDNNWLWFQLAEPSSIHNIKMIFLPDFNHESYFDIYVSKDNIEWEPVYQNANSCYFSGNLQVFDFPEFYTDKKYSFIKFVGHGNSDDDWNYLSEFKVFGFSGEDMAGTKDPFLNITIYPNPTRQDINALIHDEYTKPVILRIFDTTGKLYIEKHLEPGINNINIPLKLKAGIYIVRFFSGIIPVNTQKILIID